MDGYVLIEVNTEGQMRIKQYDGCRDLHYIDFRLEMALDLDNEFIVDCLYPSLPKDLKDVLIMAFFNYQSIPSGHGDYWSIDYEDNIILQSHVVLKTDYKEFYRQQITHELNDCIGGYKNINSYPEEDCDYYKGIVADWEEFYDEDFKPFQPQKIKLFKLK
jgi:hypothetical protein